MRPSLAVEESVRTLGYNIRVARLRRRLPQTLVAERAGISLQTLIKVEAGECGVAIGNIAAVLQALGLGDAIGTLAASSADEAGLLLEERRLPQRVRGKKKTDDAF